jgi:hypothetical protein
MKKILSTCIGILISFASMAQFENRINLYVGLGIVPFAPDSPFQAETIFDGYKTIPFVQAFLCYSFNKHISTGGAFRQIVTSKENYLLSNSFVGAGMKYNILPYDRPFSPFVYADVGVNYTFISQKQNTRIVRVAPSEDPSEIQVNEITVREPELQLNVFPSLSALVGAGVEFNFKRVRKKSFGLFLMGGYSISNTASQKRVIENFPLNESEFNYFLISGGLRFGFLRKKSLY